ncbi:MAG: lytic murein transglycosylase [Legionellaceae bacterium]|nr:lytic murein transglycosylase [Legionellaceae bacterium]
MQALWADAKPNFKVWLNQIRQEAIAQGVSPAVVDAAFAGIKEPNHRITHFSHSQPEHRLTYQKYLSTRVDKYRIYMGQKQFEKNRTLLEGVGRDFGVDPCFVAAFWGLETSYGTYMGDFPVVKSLVTLAYESDRPDFFRKQLFIALHILNEGHVSLANFKGEWAGASGQPQFLPSSWVEYAVDYDKDGRKDIWGSKPDVFASIANYMKKNGWQAGQPWAVYVKLPPHFDKALEGKQIIKPVSEWNAMGVRTANGSELPYAHLQASIVEPLGGPIFLAYPNYKMILKYNNSIYYAGAVGYLADKICHRDTV